MKPLFLLGIIVAITALPAAPLSAATFLPTTSEVTSVREEIKDDIYGANSSVVIAAPVRGDIFAAGDAIDISGPADQSVFALGRTITVSGNVGDDIRVAGSIVSVSGTVAGDIFAAGSAITIAESSKIGKDAYIAGEDLTISGTVAGDVRFAGNRLTITKDANIAGNVTVFGNTDPIIEEGSTIAGKVTTQKPAGHEREDSRSAISSTGRSVFAQLALALALLFAAPIAIKTTHGALVARPLYCLAVGAVWIILLLPITILLLVSGIGTQIGLLLMFATAPLFIASLGIAIIVMGNLAHRLVSKTDQPITWQHGVYGAVIMFALSLVGTLGFLAGAIIVIGTLGATLTSLWSGLSGRK